LKTTAEVCVPDPLGQTAQTLRLWKKIARVAKTPRRRSQEVAEKQHAAPACVTQSLLPEHKCNQRRGIAFPKSRCRLIQSLQSADQMAVSVYTEEETRFIPRGFPTMNKQILHDKLEQLRTELAGVSQLDEKTYSQLRSLVADIERAIGSEVPNSGEPLSDQAEGLVLKFEANHPQLTSALNQVAVALSNLGI
jgi:hypothetical protein